jgi:hypothetical protein
MPSSTCPFFGQGDFAGVDAFGLQFVERDAVLEQHHQQKRVHRVAEVVRPPALVLAHPKDAIADIAVHPDDIRVSVVHVVVRVPPVIAGAGGVPLESAAGDRRIAHPVVLAVHHVVADLHVVEDLRQRQHRGPGDPRGRQNAGEQQCAPTDFECPLRLDDAPDVARVALAEVGDHTLFQRVELAAKGLGLCGCQGHRGL